MAKQSCSSTRSRSSGPIPACSYPWRAASRVSVLTLGRTWHASSHGSVVRMEAEILIARRCCSSESVFSLVSLTTTAAAPPSQLAEHMGRVFG